MALAEIPRWKQCPICSEVMEEVSSALLECVRCGETAPIPEDVRIRRLGAPEMDLGE